MSSLSLLSLLSIFIMIFSSVELMCIIWDVVHDKGDAILSLAFGFTSTLFCFIFGLTIMVKCEVLYDILNIKRVKVIEKEYTICENPSEIEIEKIKYVICKGYKD